MEMKEKQRLSAAAGDALEAMNEYIRSHETTGRANYKLGIFGSWTAADIRDAAALSDMNGYALDIQEEAFGIGDAELLALARAAQAAMNEAALAGALYEPAPSMQQEAPEPAAIDESIDFVTFQRDDSGRITRVYSEHVNHDATDGPAVVQVSEDPSSALVAAHAEAHRGLGLSPDRAEYWIDAASAAHDRAIARLAPALATGEGFDYVGEDAYSELKERVFAENSDKQGYVALGEGAAVISPSDPLQRVYLPVLSTENGVWFADPRESDQNGNTVMLDRDGNLMSDNAFANDALMTELEAVWKGEVKAELISEEARLALPAMAESFGWEPGGGEFEGSDLAAQGEEPALSGRDPYQRVTKQGYVVMETDGRDALVFRQDSVYQPFVVAHGYDSKTGEWSHGAYFDSVLDAARELELGPLAEACVIWRQEDFARALADLGIDPSRENIAELLDRTENMVEWRNKCISDGNELIESAAREMRLEEDPFGPADTPDPANRHRGRLAQPATPASDSRRASRSASAQARQPSTKSRIIAQ